MAQTQAAIKAALAQENKDGTAQVEMAKITGVEPVNTNGSAPDKQGDAIDEAFEDPAGDKQVEVKPGFL